MPTRGSGKTGPPLPLVFSSIFYFIFSTFYFLFSLFCFPPFPFPLFSFLSPCFLFFFFYTAEKRRGAIILRHVGWPSGVQGSLGGSLALEASTIFERHNGTHPRWQHGWIFPLGFLTSWTWEHGFRCWVGLWLATSDADGNGLHPGRHFPRNTRGDVGGTSSSVTFGCFFFTQMK